MKTFIFSLLALSLAAVADAQTLNPFKPAGHVVVEKGSRMFSAPFGGGFNTPQFAIADLNQDGKPDLVAFEGYGKVGVRTFINYGVAGAPQYRYEPQYERSFPEISNYLDLKDYNRDGIPDLFHGGLGGFNMSKGYYANGKLHFQFVKELYYGGPTGTWANAYVGNSCIPGIVDVDGDGDLDFLSYSINGLRILFYKNMQEEYGMPRDSVRLTIASGCWGSTLQPSFRTTLLGFDQMTCDTNYSVPPTPAPTGGTPLPPVAAKGTMHGSNTLCVFDMDGDGDMDYLNGNGAFNDIQFLKNGRVEHGWFRDSIVSQDTLWQSNGMIFEESNYPAAFYVDYNGDGLKDLILAPHGGGSRDRHQIWYYQNNSTPAVPRFDFTSDSLFSDDVIDVGSYSRPLFYDYNKDGKPDMLVGGLEKLPTGQQVSRLHYYENITSLAGEPRFRYVTDDLVGISGQNVYATDPAVGDVDGDGKDDLLLGRSDGKVVFFRNMEAAANAQPVWVLQDLEMKRDGAAPVAVWAYASPAFYDINKDGKPDLVLGQDDGTLTAFVNTNTASGTVSFGPEIDSFGGVQVPDQSAFPWPFRRSRPFFGKLQEGSTKEYLLMGGYFGRMYVWDSVSTGNPLQVFPLIADSFSHIQLPDQAAPAVVDMDGDGKLEMVVGTDLGGLFLLWTGTALDVKPETAQQKDGLIVYPNPTANAFTVALSAEMSSTGAVLTVLDLTGRIIFRETWPVGKQKGFIPAAGWQSGAYLISVTTAKGTETQKIQVLR